MVYYLEVRVKGRGGREREREESKYTNTHLYSHYPERTTVNILGFVGITVTYIHA